MAQQINDIKKRMQSIQSTQKLTNANGLVASVKMQKYRKKAAANILYSKDIRFFLNAALSTPIMNITNVFMRPHDNFNPLHIVVSSDSGLCGSYNSELFRFIKENVAKDEALYVIGKIGYTYLLDNDYLVIKGINNLPDIEVGMLDKIIDDVITLYCQGEFSSIDVIYMDFINTLTYRPTIAKLVPFEVDEDFTKQEILLEPSQEELLDILFPMYISSEIYSCILDAKASENASRKNAMDTANKNGDELLEELNLNYNKARQQVITQEMTEIISGSEK